MPLFLLTLLPTALCSPICTLAPPPHSPHSTLVPCVVYRHLGLGAPTTVLKTHSCSFPFSFYFPHSLLFGFWRTSANKPPKVLVLSRTVWMCKWRRWTETVPWISTTDSYVLNTVHSYCLSDERLPRVCLPCDNYDEDTRRFIRLYQKEQNIMDATQKQLYYFYSMHLQKKEFLKSCLMVVLVRKTTNQPTFSWFYSLFYFIHVLYVNV